MENCDGSEGAGVRCKAPGVTTTTRTTTTTAITTTSDPIPGIRANTTCGRICATNFDQKCFVLTFTVGSRNFVKSEKAGASAAEG